MDHLLAANLTRVLHDARSLLNGSFNAGGSYADVWIRDLATFAEVALEVNPPKKCKDILLGFFVRQHADGECPGGYLWGSPLPDPALKFPTCLGGTATCKNNVETDQEASLVLATDAYVRVTGDVAFLSQSVHGVSVIRRCEDALDWLVGSRWHNATGLLYGGTTMDWGDMQVEPDVRDPRELDEHSHLTIDTYDNAMFLLAIRAFMRLQKLVVSTSGETNTSGASGARDWPRMLTSVTAAVRTHLWNTTRASFVPHLYASSRGSPFPPSFAEWSIRCHGSLAVAAQAGILTTDEMRRAHRAMSDDVTAVAAAGGRMTVGLTLYPPYPKATLPNLSIMAPFTYQNGGDWTWFGGRWVSALVAHNLLHEAADAVAPMAARVLGHGGHFYEWYDFHGQPQGSGKFHGSAGVLGKAIKDLQEAHR